MSFIHPALYIVTSVFAATLACTPPFDQNACNQASDLLDSCGASLTVLTDGSCSGGRKALAECIVDNAANCREVTGLYSQVDQCLAVYVGDDANLDDIPTAPDPNGNVEPNADPEDDDERCSDGEDNDGDGYIDCEDVGCSQTDNVSVCGLIGSEDNQTTCEDGFDNDGDGYIDCDDTGCQNTPGAC